MTNITTTELRTSPRTMSQRRWKLFARHKNRLNTFLQTRKKAAIELDRVTFDAITAIYRILRRNPGIPFEWVEHYVKHTIDEPELVSEICSILCFASAENVRADRLIQKLNSLGGISKSARIAKARGF